MASIGTQIERIEQIFADFTFVAELRDTNYEVQVTRYAREARPRERWKRTRRPKPAEQVKGGAGADSATARRSRGGSPKTYLRPPINSSTISGLKSVEVSPKVSNSLCAIFRKMRRIILPERVFGSAETI